MNIFLCFLQSKQNHPIPAYSFWEYYIKNGINEAGYTWLEDTEVDWAEGLTYQEEALELQSWKASTWQKTVEFVKVHKPDVFLSYLYPRQIDIQAIKEIKKLGIPCVNFFCDNVREYTVIPEEFRVFDLNWVPEFKAIRLYEIANIPYIHLPMPMWVDPKFRNIDSVEGQQLSFIGSVDIQRKLFFEELVAKNHELPLHIYGAGWLDNDQVNKIIRIGTLQKIKFQLSFIMKHGIVAYQRKLAQRKLNFPISETLFGMLKGKPSFDEYIKITKQSIVTIGINRYPSYQFPLYMPNTYSRLRDIEAPMLGACYLTEWTEGLDQYYEIGKEIRVYSTTTELIDQFMELSINQSLRKDLRIRGQRKALNEMSIHSSLAKLKKAL